MEGIKGWRDGGDGGGGLEVWRGQRGQKGQRGKRDGGDGDGGDGGDGDVGPTGRQGHPSSPAVGPHTPGGLRGAVRGLLPAPGPSPPRRPQPRSVRLPPTDRGHGRLPAAPRANGTGTAPPDTPASTGGARPGGNGASGRAGGELPGG